MSLFSLSSGLMLPGDEVKVFLLKSLSCFLTSRRFFSWKDLGMGNQENTFFLPMV
jgi:hypothetical protein